MNVHNTLDLAVVGAWGDDDGGSDSGSAYLFVYPTMQVTPTGGGAWIHGMSAEFKP